MPSRRWLLGAMVAVATPGCLGGPDRGTATDSTTEWRTASPRSRNDCSAATVDPQGVSPEGYQPEGETVTLYRDYLRVEVEATTDDVPDLHGRIEGCDRVEEIRRSVPGAGRHTFEFGPFGHHCVQGYEFWLEGCR